MLRVPDLFVWLSRWIVNGRQKKYGALPQEPSRIFAGLGSELRATVRQDILGDHLKAEDMFHKRSFIGLR